MGSIIHINSALEPDQLKIALEIRQILKTNHYSTEDIELILADLNDFLVLIQNENLTKLWLNPQTSANE